jgi:hypothetical protein
MGSEKLIREFSQPISSLVIYTGIALVVNYEMSKADR